MGDDPEHMPAPGVSGIRCADAAVETLGFREAPCLLVPPGGRELLLDLVWYRNHLSSDPAGC